MREIKCRGFRNFKGNALYPLDKRWIYGYYYFNAGEHWIKNKADMAQTFIVEEKSVGQYTSRKDKNGKEIYEGDIVNCYDDKQVCGKGEIKFGRFMSSHEGGHSRYHYHQGFYILGKDGKQIWDNSSEDIDWQEVEIIGNIYENPELLEKPRPE